MAQRIPEATVEAVRQKTNIVDVVGQYVQLKKQGKNLFGLCPFHEERTPSFSVNEQKQIFHCFSCGRGGNVFNFLMDLEKLSFPEAVAKVAQMENIPVDIQVGAQTQTTVDPQIATQRKMYQKAQQFFAHILINTTTGEPALKYLQKRKMTDQAIQTYGIGYLPEQPDLLLHFLKDQQFTFEDLRKSGLFSETQSGQLRDRFSGRVMFPIRDSQGQTIAFSGRILNQAPNEPKYLNSPETMLFNKSKVLFNFDLAKGAIRQAKKVYLFEGFMDVIAAYEAGLSNGVASMGTSLTDEQLQQLTRMTNHLIVCYDGDEPGIQAAHRALGMLQQQRSVDAGVVVLPDGKDPDEYVHTVGADAFKQQLEQAVLTPVAFKLRYLQRGLNLANEKDRLTYTDQALQTLVQVASPVERELYLNQVAETVSLSPESLQQQLQTLQRQQPSRPKQAVRRQQVAPQAYHRQQVHYSGQELAERCLLYLMFHHPDVKTTVEQTPDFQFIHENYQEIYLLWQSFLAEGHSPDISGFIDYVPDDMQALVAELDSLELPAEVNETAVQDYIKRIMVNPLQEQIKTTQASLDEAKRLGDQTREADLTVQLVQLFRQLKKA
ncbi:dnaG protein [Lactobacillus selangorensis]|uniref:DNA primase n=1 Tax=Lactobacillus selangorensis TaxID=81857 RepID=A0A0R2G0A1_9LACO|nr:DNA primase [Lactobacillus selangorensis]KRN29518.1 dnaG protein [Lactobacillus selangorensis]KRN33952.1 dnaG protein [Lactobacillus selangorensis]